MFGEPYHSTRISTLLFIINQCNLRNSICLHNLKDLIRESEIHLNCLPFSHFWDFACIWELKVNSWNNRETQKCKISVFLSIKPNMRILWLIKNEIYAALCEEKNDYSFGSCGSCDIRLESYWISSYHNVQTWPSLSVQTSFQRLFLWQKLIVSFISIIVI